MQNEAFRNSHNTATPLEQNDKLWRSLSLASAKNARKLLPFEQAKKLNVLPMGIISMKNKRLAMFAAPSEDLQIKNGLEFALDMEVRLVAIDPYHLRKAIFKAYHGDEDYLQSKIEQLGIDTHTPRPIFPNSHLNTENEGEAGKLLSALINYSIAREASDLHIVPRAEGTYANLRIGNNLYTQQKELGSPALHQQLINRLKVLCNLDIAQKSLPQDGSFRFEYIQSEINIRVGIMPTIYGEKAVLRFLGCGELIQLEQLGLNQVTLGFIHRYMQDNDGSLILSGPTGSGKTTTLYSILNHLSRHNLSLCSIEDPVEVYLKGVSQSQINETKGVNYPTCLKALLRQDPDVILLGEMRDAVSAQIAMQAALTGHGILTTVHARDVFSVFLRLKHFEVDPTTIANAVRLVIHQNLIPKLCDKCKVFDLEGYRQVKSSGEDFEVFKAVGCTNCDYSGFHGRLLATECLWVDQKISEAFAKSKLDYQGLKKCLKDSNYWPLSASMSHFLMMGQVELKK